MNDSALEFTTGIRITECSTAVHFHTMPIHRMPILQISIVMAGIQTKSTLTAYSTGSTPPVNGAKWSTWEREDDLSSWDAVGAEWEHEDEPSSWDAVGARVDLPHLLAGLRASSVLLVGLRARER
eukprot:COSAG02_NODE_5037_length_4704_cov_2.206253_3_plen_125_part_00